VACRGSRSLGDWRQNLDAVRVSGTKHADLLSPGMRALAGIHVHRGFRASAASLIEPVAAFCERLRAHYGTLDGHVLYMSGHSLGGAIAMLLFLVVMVGRLRDVAPLVAGAYTFGQPRVVYKGGDTDRVLALSAERLWPLHRLVNCSDVVPHVPPATLFRHVGRRIYIDKALRLRSFQSSAEFARESAQQLWARGLKRSVYSHTMHEYIQAVQLHYYTRSAYVRTFPPLLLEFHVCISCVRAASAGAFSVDTVQVLHSGNVHSIALSSAADASASTSVPASASASASASTSSAPSSTATSSTSASTSTSVPASASASAAPIDVLDRKTHSSAVNRKAPASASGSATTAAPAALIGVGCGAAASAVPPSTPTPCSVCGNAQSNTAEMLYFQVPDYDGSSPVLVQLLHNDTVRAEAELDTEQLVGANGPTVPDAYLSGMSLESVSERWHNQMRSRVAMRHTPLLRDAIGAVLRGGSARLRVDVWRCVLMARPDADSAVRGLLCVDAAMALPHARHWAVRITCGSQRCQSEPSAEATRNPRFDFSWTVSARLGDAATLQVFAAGATPATQRQSSSRAGDAPLSEFAPILLALVPIGAEHALVPLSYRLHHLRLKLPHTVGDAGGASPADPSASGASARTAAGQKFAAANAALSTATSLKVTSKQKLKALRAKATLHVRAFMSL
jgi:Lipase (class 3)